jgi:hypothetical protein
MRTFLVWAVSVYAAIGAAAAISLYRIARKYCGTGSRARDVWNATFCGMLWPAALVQLARLVWRGLKPED